MPDRFNRLKNADFADGAKRPRNWNFTAEDTVEWTFADEEDGVTRAVVVRNGGPAADGYFSQLVRCKPDHWYRIETVVTSRCDGHGGAATFVVPRRSDREWGDPVCLAVVSRTLGPATLRAYYHAPSDAKSFELRVGMFDASGELTLHSALVIPNIEPEVRGNPLAVPPPPYTYPTPRRVRRVCVCDDVAEERPLVALLRRRFGRGAIEHRRSAGTRPTALKSDALIIAGSKPPARVRSLSGLERLAEQQLVIVSLDAFAEIAACGLTMRTIEQADDPICAKIAFANFITRGFALNDVAPWASTTGDARVYRQRHYRRGATLNRLMKEHGFVAILVSETDSESTSDHPICLYKEIAGGGIIVFDTDPIETLPTTRDEANLPAFALLNMLGTDQVAAGQYTVPADSEKEWNNALKELSLRLPLFHLTGTDRHDLLVEVGGGASQNALPAPERPMILIRSGLRGDDFAGLYGCVQYLKNLVRPGPHANPYLARLLQRYRLAWVPLSAPFQPSGWDESLFASAAEVDGAFESDSIAAVIDVTTSPVQQLRIVYARAGAAFDRHAGLLGSLASAFSSGRYTYRAVGEGEHLARRDALAWRRAQLSPVVCVDQSVFDTSLHAGASVARANLIRIEVPGMGGDFVSNSIWRTDLVATTLEHVVGVHYGVLAMNRGSSRVAFGDHPPLGPGDIIDIPSGGKQNGRRKRVG